MTQETDQKLVEFYTTFQIELQKRFHETLLAVDPIVAEADASLGDLSFCVGSVFASILFELVRDPDGLVITDEQAELCCSLLEPFITGFSEKLVLLKGENPERIDLIKE